LIYLYLLNIFRKALIQPIGTATRILRLFSGRVSPPKIGALVESAQLNIFRKAPIQPIGTATRILRLFSGRVSPPKIGALVESAQTGRSVLTPAPSASFSVAQQVSLLILCIFSLWQSLCWS